jgi:uncharacterized protein (DUF1499 family)
VHKFEKISYEGSSDDVRAKLMAAIVKMGGEIVRFENEYIHAQFMSKAFGFVDDLEILIEEGSLQIRSASRVGHSDMGANRKRVETLKSEL